MQAMLFGLINIFKPPNGGVAYAELLPGVYWEILLICGLLKRTAVNFALLCQIKQMQNKYCILAQLL